MKKYLKQNKFLIFLFTIFIIASEGLKLYIARLNGTLVDTATSGKGEALYSLFYLIVVLSLIMPLCFYFYTFFIQYFRARIQRSMKKDMFGSILRISYKDYLRKEEGTYIAAYTTQIKSLDDSYFYSIFGILQIIFGLLIALVFLYLIHPPFVLYSVISVIPAVFIPNLLKPLISRMQEEKLRKVSANIASLNEYFEGLDTILFFRRRKNFQELFFAQNEEVMRISAKIPAYMLFSVNLSYLVLQLYTVLIIFLSTYEIAKGNITIGAYIASIHIISDFTGGLSFATHYIQQFSIAKKTLQHIRACMEDENETAAAADVSDKSVSIQKVEKISFDHVSFSYGEKPLIADMSYTFDQKGIYQIVGASGSGKTTLMNLLCGYVTAQDGRTAVNGETVASICNLSELFTIMRQEAIFFDGTLCENITMFADYSEQEISDGLKALGVPYLSEKLDDREINLSGGEARRVMLLRALLRDKDILILDEPLANLDKESIAYVEERLKNIRDKFVFVITHEPLGIPVHDTIRVGAE